MDETPTFLSNEILKNFLEYDDRENKLISEIYGQLPVDCIKSEVLL